LENKIIIKKIVLGTWSISGDFKKPNKKNAKKLIKYCYQKGINEFDVAPNYGCGFSEKILGQVFSLYKKKPKFNTKIGNNHKKLKSFDINILKETFHKSLKNLKVKKINILFLHNPVNIRNYKEIIFFLKRLKKKKKINNFGLSISRKCRYSKNVIKRFPIIQLDHNILFFENKLNKLFNKKIIYARSPFASGMLCNQLKKKKFLKTDIRSKWLTETRKKNILLQIKFLTEFYKQNIFSLATRYVLNDSFACKIIFGFRNVTQFKKFIKLLKNIQNSSINFQQYEKLQKKLQIFKKKGF